MAHQSEQDVLYMQRAMALAKRGQGRVEPNPMVGCVVVRSRRVIGEGYHRRYGGPHAEVDALRRCTGSPRGATAYVTLEPCCHHGKTGPCTDALIAAGITRVVVAMKDPSPAVAGKGLAQLRRAGIAVQVGLCNEQARILNAPYLKLRTVGRPWVILKWAQSLDGKIATRTGDSKWITSQAARKHAHRIRGRVDAVIVGVGTARADDPALTCRQVPSRRTATRIVVDSQLTVPATLQLVRAAGQTPTVIATTRRAVQAHRRLADQLVRAGCDVVTLPSHSGHVDLGALLDELGRRQMTNVMVEGGGRLLGAFVDQGLADEAVAFISPRLIGGAQAIGPLHGLGVRHVRDADPLPIETRRLGDEAIHRMLLTDPLSFGA